MSIRLLGFTDRGSIRIVQTRAYSLYWLHAYTQLGTHFLLEGTLYNVRGPLGRQGIKRAFQGTHFLLEGTLYNVRGPLGRHPAGDPLLARSIDLPSFILHS